MDFFIQKKVFNCFEKTKKISNLIQRKLRNITNLSC